MVPHGNPCVRINLVLIILNPGRIPGICGRFRIELGGKIREGSTARFYGGGSGGGAGDCADFVFEEAALSRGTRSGLRAGGGGSGKAAAAAVAVIRRCRGAVEGYGRGFEGAGSHLGCGEGAEPHTLAAAREPDLRHPTAP